MTKYQRIATVEEYSGVELFEVLDVLSSRVGDFKFLEFVHGDVYLVKESEDGDVELIADFEEFGGDYWAETDYLADELSQSNQDSGRYEVASFVGDMERKIVWIKE